MIKRVAFGFLLTIVLGCGAKSPSTSSGSGPATDDLPPDPAGEPQPVDAGVDAQEIDAMPAELVLVPEPEPSKDPVAEYLSYAEQTRDKACACPDKACYDLHFDALSAWMTKNRDRVTKAKWSKAQKAKTKQLGKEMKDCEKKFPAPPAKK